MSQSAAIEVADLTCPFTLVSTLYVQRSEYDAYTALSSRCIRFAPAGDIVSFVVTRDGPSMPTIHIISELL